MEEKASIEVHRDARVRVTAITDDEEPPVFSFFPALARMRAEGEATLVVAQGVVIQQLLDVSFGLPAPITLRATQLRSVDPVQPDFLTAEGDVTAEIQRDRPRVSVIDGFDDAFINVPSLQD